MPHEAMLASLADATTRRLLRPLDLAFARFIAGCDPEAAPSLLLMAALASRQLGDGHPCLDLQAVKRLAAEQTWPSPWVELLSGSASLSSPLLAGSNGIPVHAPLVLDGHRLYLRRYWQYECKVAEGIHARLQMNPVPAANLHDELRRLFPASSAEDVNWPRVACAIAARGNFSIITGGPGTGKTTTVVRLLGLLQTLHLREHSTALRIRLAAPTGKAAARLNTSIARQIASLAVDGQVRSSIPTEVETLHRLLGARADSRRYHRDRQHPLHVDVLVIDEASMIDLEMMAAVLDALPSHARLILIGDKDQLSSVEAGAVLGDLGRRAEAGHYSEATVAWLKEISGDNVQAFLHDDAQPLDQHVAMLRQSHRFDSTSSMGQLAVAVNVGNTEDVRRLLASDSSDIAWFPDGVQATPMTALALEGAAASKPRKPGSAAPSGFRFYLERLQHERPAPLAEIEAYRQWAQRVLDAFHQFQLLCAVRRGPAGTEQLNRDIATSLMAHGLVASDRGWYEGRPVMMTRNDYSLGLMNGDVGIALRMPGADDELRLYVAFPITRGTVATDEHDGTSVRCVLPSRLGDVETVYAMTVHKSQGSEFEHVALVLPEDAPATLTRELLYTGITRARRWLSLVGTPATVEQAIAERTQRYSGLAERLAANR